MHNHLRAMAVFAKVADAGSFRAAGHQLGISASVVSHHVTSLERHLDTPLIYRTTRKLSLTAAGKELAVAANAMLDAAEEGLGRIGNESANPSGRLRITAPAMLQYARFVTRVSTFIKHFPKVEVSIEFSDSRANIVEEGFDLAFRVGWLKDSSLISRKLAEGRLFMCASPKYLKSRDKVTGPGDLENLEMIEIAGVATRVELVSKEQKSKKRMTQFRHRISVNSGFAARRIAEEDCGVAMLPDFFVQEAMAAGRLVDVLPEWRAPAFGIFAVWPSNVGTNFLRKSFVEFVAEIGKSKSGPDTEMGSGKTRAG